MTEQFFPLLQKQLMESLRKKLGVLREAQRGLQDDVRANAQLGEEVGGNLKSFCPWPILTIIVAFDKII